MGVGPYPLLGRPRRTMNMWRERHMANTFGQKGLFDAAPEGYHEVEPAPRIAARNDAPDAE